MPDILKGTIKDSNGNSLYPITSIDNVINLQTALDGKLDKSTSTTTYDKAYVKLADGTQSSFNIAGSVVAYSLIFRDGNGNASVSTPTATNHIANKSYVDGLVPQIKRYI